MKPVPAVILGASPGLASAAMAERVSRDTALAAGRAGMKHFGRVATACATAEKRMLDALGRAMIAGGRVLEQAAPDAPATRLIEAGR